MCNIHNWYHETFCHALYILVDVSLSLNIPSNTALFARELHYGRVGFHNPWQYRHVMLSTCLMLNDGLVYVKALSELKFYSRSLSAQCANVKVQEDFGSFYLLFFERNLATQNYASCVY